MSAHTAKTKKKKKKKKKKKGNGNLENASEGYHDKKKQVLNKPTTNSISSGSGLDGVFYI